MKLYLAYGANTNLANMAVRCPEARYVGNITIPGHRLVFRGVADVTPSRGSKVVCAMWIVSPKDEEALDKFEGFPNLYVKRYITVRLQGKRHRIMFYTMRTRRYEAEPSATYEEVLRSGYADCGLPTAQIDAAIRHAHRWTERNPAPVEVRHGSWADKVIAPLPEVDAERDEAAAEQFMFDWYSNHAPADDAGKE